jgi:hypothetical protein
MTRQVRFFAIAVSTRKIEMQNDDLPKIVHIRHEDDEDGLMSPGVGWLWVSYVMLLVSLGLWLFV